MRRLQILSGLLALTSLTLAGAQRTPVVLELFTSEACSSCPPADKLLETLDRSQPFEGADLIVLSEHVDYWNGSWTDPYSSKLFSQRQRQYAERLGLESVYTPELVVDGREEGVGSNAATTKASVSKALTRKKVQLSLDNVRVSNKQVKLHAASSETTTANGPLTLYIALAENKVSSNVRHGENAGRSLTHVAVVKVLAPAGSVKGGTRFEKDISIPLPSTLSTDGLRVVAFLQSEQSREIVGAAQARL